MMDVAWSVMSSFGCPVSRGAARWSGLRACHLVHEGLELVALGVGEVRQRRTYGTGRATDRGEAGLDDRHRVARLAVADLRVGDHEVVEHRVDRGLVLAAYGVVEVQREL